MAQYMDRGIRRDGTDSDVPSESTASVTDAAVPSSTLDMAPTGASAAGGSAFDPDGEDRYWRDNYRSRPYADDTLSYDHYRPAYRYGWESRELYADRRWDQVERDLQRGWRQNRGESRLGWGDAKLAARDAWQRIGNLLADQRQNAQNAL